MVPARADGPLMPGEKWASKTSLAATIRREAPQPPYPYTQTDADIAQGARLYVQNCAVCHGTAHSTPNAIARGMGVRPPQFTKHGVDDDPEGETYWKIEHGIRFTGDARVRPEPRREVDLADHVLHEARAQGPHGRGEVDLERSRAGPAADADARPHSSLPAKAARGLRIAAATSTPEPVDSADAHRAVSARSTQHEHALSARRAEGD